MPAGFITCPLAVMAMSFGRLALLPLHAAAITMAALLFTYGMGAGLFFPGNLSTLMGAGLFFPSNLSALMGAVERDLQATLREQ